MSTITIVTAVVYFAVNTVAAFVLELAAVKGSNYLRKSSAFLVATVKFGCSVINKFGFDE
jgi:hypothetical protein